MIIVVILANCYTLAVTGRAEDSLFYLEPHLHAQLEYYFVLIFTGELGARAVAMGIFTDAYHVRAPDHSHSRVSPPRVPSMRSRVRHGGDRRRLPAAYRAGVRVRARVHIAHVTLYGRRGCPDDACMSPLPRPPTPSHG